MNKMLAVGGLSLALVGAGFAVNNVMVDKAGAQVPVQVLNALQNLDPKVVQVQRLSSTVNGSQIEEEYVVYFVIDGKRAEGEPLYINHSAKIGLFGSAVDGSLFIVKDKGIAKKFIEEVTTFNDHIGYSFTTASGEIDLKGDLQVGYLKFGRESFELGKLTFGVVGSPDNFTYSANLPSFVCNRPREQLTVSDININAVDGTKVAFRSFGFTIGKLSMFATHNNEGFQLSGVKWNTSLSNETSATLNADIGVDNLSMNIAGVPQDDFSMNFKANVKGVQTALLEELADIIEYNKYSRRTNSDRVDAIIDKFLGAGIDGNDVSLTVNGSSAKGSITLAPADYSNMRSYEKSSTVLTHISSQIDFNLETSLVNSIPNIAPMIKHYFTLSPETNMYTGTFKLADGLPSINDQVLR